MKKNLGSKWFLETVSYKRKNFQFSHHFFDIVLFVLIWVLINSTQLSSEQNYFRRQNTSRNEKMWKRQSKRFGKERGLILNLLRQKNWWAYRLWYMESFKCCPQTKIRTGTQFLCMATGVNSGSHICFDLQWKDLRWLTCKTELFRWYPQTSKLTNFGAG